MRKIGTSKVQHAKVVTEHTCTSIVSDPNNHKSIQHNAENETFLLLHFNNAPQAHTFLFLFLPLLPLFVQVTIQATADVGITIALGLFDNMADFYTNMSLCTLGTIDSIGDTSKNNQYGTTRECPTLGDYHIYTYFTVPAISQDVDMRYTPDIHLNFTTAQNYQSCYVAGTRSTYYRSQERRRLGIIVLGVAVVITCLFFSCCIYLSWRRKKRLVTQNEPRFEYSMARHGQVVPLDGQL